MKKAAFFFCMDNAIDPVASNVFLELSNICPLETTPIEMDGFPVLKHTDRAGNEFHFVRLNDVLSHDYIKYLPFLKQNFDSFDFSGVVNWHQGANAPDKILCSHTTGDMNSGVYGAAHPVCFRNLLHSMEKHRLLNDLTDFKVISEATHWSGVLYDQPVSLIAEFKSPIVDIEIGSYPESWGNKIAAKVLASSLLDVFVSDEPIKSFLCVGGMHFANSFSELAMNTEFPVGVSHLLASQWLPSGNYDTEEGFEKFKKAADSTIGGLAGFIFHDSLKGIFKEQLKKLAVVYDKPFINSKQIKSINALPVW